MIQHVGKYSLYEIFDKKSKLSFVVPKYQREYTWGYAEWRALYDDISENEWEYFVGSIICINQGDSISPICEVIDGQQRLTTLSILLAALYYELSQLKMEFREDDDKFSEYVGIKNSLCCESSENQLRLLPQIQNYNREDYNYLMKEEAGVSLSKYPDLKLQKPLYYSLRKLSRCFRYFIYKIEEDLKGKDNPVQTLFEIYDKVTHTILVKIEVNSHSDAYILFESLNNRGVQLTAIDLMKNLIMACAESYGLKADDCYEQWRLLLSNLSDDYKIQERFFRHYYNAFKAELNEPFRTNDLRKEAPLGYIATKSNLLNIYEKLIHQNLPHFLGEIIGASEIYKIFLEPEKYLDLAYAKELVKLNHIQGVPSYILLIYLFKYKKELALNDNQMTSIIRYLVVFFVRRSVTDYPGTRDVPRIFMSILDQIRLYKYQGNDVVNCIFDRLKLEYANDELFLSNLKGDIYTSNTDAARFVLCALAENMMTKEVWTDLWERKSGKFIWTIEHIFPEGENIPAAWVDMIAGGDKDLAKQYLNEFTHKLGNLTITGYNSELSNFDFIKKRDRKSKDGKDIGYRNGLEINKELATREEWHVEDINDRTNRLSLQLVDLFKL